MPIYDYSCEDCQKTFELVILGAGEAVCPTCGSVKLTKLISAPAPQGKSGALIKSARAAAAREGYFSNYSAGERAQLRK